MSHIAYYLTFDRPVPGLGADASGRGLARHHMTLNALAQDLGLPPLEHFFGTCDADLAPCRTHGDDCAVQEDVYWHDATEGLSSFSTLSSALRWQPGHDATDALPDLENFTHALRQAQHHAARFYLAIDF